jgi:hypothetical protein
MEHADQLSKLIGICQKKIGSLIDRRFFGEVVIKFENGKISVVKITESYKV